MSKPKVLILHANGTNRDVELASAFELAGALPEIKPLTTLRANNINWQDYQLLAVPGGFSYADTLGAGKLFALELKAYFAEHLQEFVASGKPVIGICNGFQALVKAGILPGNTPNERDATLTFNADGQFECRWITLAPQSKTCIWTRDLNEVIYCPVAHGEGQLKLANPKFYDTLVANDQIALRYALPNGKLANQEFPYNPNGSIGDIAGLCNLNGNVIGLMPHPEDHVLHYQHPRWTRGESGHLGLRLLEHGVKYAK
jgi:phosphoribosylformylglycinamidine synthase